MLNSALLQCFCLLFLGTFFGVGVYFALNASYSDQERYAKPDAQGSKYIYLCRVLTGRYVKGESGMKALPPRKGEIHFNSAVDNVQNPTIFVSFLDFHSYPKYLIKYS